jgi:hypothetical protein
MAKEPDKRPGAGSAVDSGVAKQFEFPAIPLPSG